MLVESFVLSDHDEGNEIVRHHDIPFSVRKMEGRVCPIKNSKNGINGAHSVQMGENCDALFFLGMTTEGPECSEWWGQSERFYYHGARLFIGDRLGRINIIYDDATMETIPVIFGVNIWPYELVETLKENENGLNTYGGPYSEPFLSDRNARKLRNNSLVLMENDSEKCMKYILGIKTKNCIVKEITFNKEMYKEAGMLISAVTGLKRGAEANPLWKIIEPDYFMKKVYFPAMDKLARRLYQFRDEIPTKDTVVVPQNYKGPGVRFSGNSAADIFTNVYYHNLHDICTQKIDPTGKPHTSSPNAPNFSLYVGLGTFSNNKGVFYDHMWSRDIGRILIEAVKAGENERTVKSPDILNYYLYDKSQRFDNPNWKRIANCSELNNEDLMKAVSGKENDGHAAIMMFIYNAYNHGIIDAKWLKKNKKAIFDAIDWFIWQIENPDKSNFNKVLYSESEASTQIYGGYDLFSNTFAYFALKAYEILAEVICDLEMKKKCINYSALLKEGIMERFTSIHPRYGRIFIDTIDDCWTWEYKRFAPLFLLPDFVTYDAEKFDQDLYGIFRNTYLAQKEDYFSCTSGRQMGYGQGYLTQTCILMDEYQDFTECIEQVAFFCYHHTDHNYIVPEGVIMHPSGRFWFRNGDLGNAVQQGEIIKCARILIGLDDLKPEEGLNIIPRLPNTWVSLEVTNYNVTVITDGKRKNIPLSMKYERTDKGYKLKFNAKKPVKIKTVRFGPFETNIQDIVVKCQYNSRRVEMSGKSFIYVDIDSEEKELDINVGTF